MVGILSRGDELTPLLFLTAVPVTRAAGTQKSFQNSVEVSRNTGFIFNSFHQRLINSYSEMDYVCARGISNR